MEVALSLKDADGSIGDVWCWSHYYLHHYGASPSIGYESIDDRMPDFCKNTY